MQPRRFFASVSWVDGARPALRSGPYDGTFRTSLQRRCSYLNITGRAPHDPACHCSGTGWCRLSYCSSVDRSPISAPVSCAFNRRRMILPERVFGNADNELNRRRCCDRPHLAAHMLDQPGEQRIRCGVSRAQLHEGHDGFALQRIGNSDRRGFRNRRMRHQRAFHFRRTNAMASDVEHVVRTSDDARCSRRRLLSQDHR